MAELTAEDRAMLGLQIPAKPESEEKFRELFDSIDLDKNGTLDANELAKWAALLGAAGSEGMETVASEMLTSALPNPVAQCPFYLLR